MRGLRSGVYDHFRFEGELVFLKGKLHSLWANYVLRGQEIRLCSKFVFCSRVCFCLQASLDFGERSSTFVGEFTPAQALKCLLAN